MAPIHIKTKLKLLLNSNFISEYHVYPVHLIISSTTFSIIYCITFIFISWFCWWDNNFAWLRLYYYCYHGNCAGTNYSNL